MPDFGLGLTSSILPEDISANFLSKIFGSSFYTVTDFVPQGAVKVIFDLFGAVNSFALVILVISIAFFTATGVIGTAHEGKVLGGKLHSFWVPVRLIASAGFLVPIKHGLCLFQVLLLLAVGVSIEFANKLYSIYLNSTYETSFSAPSGIYRGEEANKIASMILSNIVYMDYFLDNYADIAEETKQKYQSVASSDSDKDWTHAYGYWTEKGESTRDDSVHESSLFKKIAYQFNNPHIDPSIFGTGLFDMGHSKVMGHLEFDCSGVNPDYMYACFDQSHVIDKAINRIKNEVAPAFREYTKGDLTAIQGSAGKAYQDIIKELAYGLERKSLQMYKTKYNALKQEAQERFTDYKNLGWASAGSIYHSMSMIRAKAMDSLQVKVDIYNGKLWEDNPFQPDDIKFGLLKKHFIQSLQKITPAELSGELEESSLTKVLKKAGFDRDNWFISIIQDVGKGNNVGPADKKTNPIDAFAAIGHTMINSVLVALALMGAIAIASTGAGIVLSTGFLMIVGPVFIGGFLLAYYVPALPFIIWVSALIGWFIVVIESLVAAPLWIIGISRIDGDEGFFGRTGQQGLFLFFGVLIRPFAMLLGFCIAATVIDQVGALLADLFSTYLADRESNTAHSDVPIISHLILFFIFAATWTSFVHKIFGLVAYLPDVMMQWIGATGHHLGSDKDEQQVSGTVQRATGHAAISANMAAEGIRGGARWKAGKDKELMYGNNRNTEKRGTAQNNDTRSENAGTSIVNKATKGNDSSF